MARETNRAVTFTEVKSMAAETTGTHQYLIALKTIPTSLQCMTKEDLVEYVNLDTAYSANSKSLTNYTTKQLVPYELIAGTVRNCVAANMSNQGYGYFTYYVDLGTTTGVVRLNYNAMGIPDAFIIEWNGQVVDSGWVGNSGYTLPASRANNTGNPGTGEGSIYLKKTSASPNMAVVTVDASAVSGTGWDVHQVRCPITFNVSEVSKTTNSITISWNAFTSGPQSGATPRATPKYTVSYQINHNQGPIWTTLGSADVAIGTTTHTISNLQPNENVSFIKVYYYDEYGKSVTTLNELSITTTGVTSTLTISPTGSQSVPNTRVINTLTVTSNTSWTLTSNATSWLTVAASSGTGNSNPKYTHEANTGPARTGIITAKTTDNAVTRTLTINQAAGNAETLSLSTTYVVIPSYGGTQFITVYTNTTWQAFVDSGAYLWPGSGTGNTSIEVGTMFANSNAYSIFYSIMFYTPGGLQIYLNIEQLGSGGGGGFEPI